MKLYAKYLSMLLKGQMQYRTSFFLTMAGQFLTSFSAFLGVYFLFSRFHTVEGFTFSEVLLCFSIVLTAYSLTECFLRGFDVFPGLIRTGELDRLLLRPRGVIFQVLTANVAFSRLGRLLQAIVMLGYAAATGGVVWSIDKLLTVLFMLLGGVVTFTALFLLAAACSFFTVEGLEVFNIFTNGSNEFGKYPLSVYGEGVLRLLTYVVPLALVQYYPLLYLIGRSEEIVLAFLPFCSFVFLLPCLLLFRFGLRHYRSTGS